MPARSAFLSRHHRRRSPAAFQGDQFGQRRVKSYVELLESERVAQLVATEVGGELTSQTVKSEISAQADPNTVLVTATVIDGSALRSLAITQSLATQFVTFVTGLETPSGQSVPSVNLEVTTAPTLNPTPITPATAAELRAGFPRRTAAWTDPGRRQGQDRYRGAVGR